VGGGREEQSLSVIFGTQAESVTSSIATVVVGHAVVVVAAVHYDNSATVVHRSPVVDCRQPGRL